FGFVLGFGQNQRQQVCGGGIIDVDDERVLEGGDSSFVVAAHLRHDAVQKDGRDRLGVLLAHGGRDLLGVGEVVLLDEPLGIGLRGCFDIGLGGVGGFERLFRL